MTLRPKHSFWRIECLFLACGQINLINKKHMGFFALNELDPICHQGIPTHHMDDLLMMVNCLFISCKVLLAYKCNRVFEAFILCGF